MRTPSLLDVMESVVEAYQAELHTSIPARVLSYDHTTQKATVQPLIKRRYNDAGNDPKGLEDMPQIVGVPIVFPGSSVGTISFPIKAGDIVLCIFSERSLDTWLFSGGTETIDPQDGRKHNYSDAIAIPGLFTFPTAIGSDPEDIVLTYKDAESEVRLKSNGDVTVTTPGNFQVTAGGTVDISCTGNMNLHSDGNVNVTSGGIVNLN